MADIGPLIKLFLFKSSSSALSVLFQIFPEVGESHIALLQEGVVHGERSSHALRFVSLLCQLQVFAQHGSVVGMSTILDNLFSSAQRTLSSQVSNALFSHNDVHIVLRAVHMAAHRHNG